MSGVGKVVCVTGASGYVASWLVKLLLQRGYTVKASVRDPNDPKKTEHLRALDGAKERLHLLEANLMEEGSFDSVVEGCEGVFHTASPFYHNVTDPQAELIDPSVKGTLNVLGSCTKVSSVKRVVITSSVAAVLYNGRPRTPDVVADETWFSDPEFCKEIKGWYLLSKTLAEEVAWKFAKENGINMVTINPSMVIGPLLQPSLNTSAAAILNVINGANTFPNATFGWVNVKDVANAHIQAFEIPSANGRYCLVESVAHYSEIVRILHELYPSLLLPERSHLADDLDAELEIPLSKAELSMAELVIARMSSYDLVRCIEDIVKLSHLADDLDAELEIPLSKAELSMAELVIARMSSYDLVRCIEDIVKLCADDKPYVPTYQVSKERAKSLGIDFIPLKESIKETVESLKEKNFFSTGL